MARLLLVDDEPAILAILTTLLTSNGHECVTACNGQEALDLLEKQEFDLMTSDMRMPVMDGMDLLRQTRERGYTLPIVMMTAFATVEAASETLKLGVFDFIRKPFKIDALMETINGALASGAVSLKTDGSAADEDIPRVSLKFDMLIAESPAMKQACDMIERVGPTGAPAIIYGEQGTEKDLVAKALHHLSPRKDGPMLALELQELNESEIGANLFGGGEGADGQGHGALELSNGGTLLLDDIDLMPFDVQEKLLLFLKEQVINPGAANEKSLNVRVLGAANETTLDELVRTNKFKRDLQMRMSVIRIKLSPLRERQEDILPLFVQVVEEKAGKKIQIETIAQKKLKSYAWPGNYDELKEMAETASDKLEGNSIKLSGLPDHIAKVEVKETHARASSADDTLIRGRNLKEFLSNQLKQQ